MKRIIGLLGMTLSFIFFVGALVLIGSPTANKPIVFFMLAAGVVGFFLSFKLFRSGQPLATSEAHLAEAKATEEFNKNLPNHHYYTSAGISSVLVAIYAVLVATNKISFSPTISELYKVGGGFGEDAAHGQAWRLLTQIFLHGSVGHLFSNVIGLIAAGRLLDYLAGRKNLLAVFLVGGVAASMASSLFNPTVVSIGASGAVFAVYGAIFSSYFFNPKTKNLNVPKGIWLASAYQAFNSIMYGFQHVGIDNAAHVGGLIGGFAVMSLVYRLSSENENKASAVFGGATAVLAAFAFTVMPMAVKQTDSNPVALAEKADAVSEAMSVIENAEIEFKQNWKEVSAANEEVKMKWVSNDFLPRYDRAIDNLKSITDTGLAEGLVELKNSVLDSAVACTNMYHYAFEVERNPASEDATKVNELKDECTAKMKARYSLVEKILGSQK